MKRLIVLCLLTICQMASAASDELNYWQSLEQTLGEQRQDGQIPGLSAAVVSNGKVVWQLNYGFAEQNREIPISANTPFWVASVTKPFVALTYLMMSHENKINFSERAADTPQFNRLCRWLESSKIPFAEGLDCGAPITIEHILKHQVNAPPGTRFMYNPIMYSRLSRHLEHKYGDGVDAVEGRHNQLAREIDQRILKPLGMKNSMASMWDSERARVYQRMADGFQLNGSGGRVKLPQPDKHIAGGAGLVSSVSDLVRFEAGLISGDWLSSDIRKTLLETPTYMDGTIAPYGYGWYYQTFNKLKLMWHSGWDSDHGYSAIFLRVPEKRLALIVLANSETLWWGNSLTKAEIHKSPIAKTFLDLVANQ